MVPSESLLAEPFNVTVAPEVTLWAAPAFAVGAAFAPPLLLLLLLLLLLPPPPLLQALSKTVTMPARVRPILVWRMQPYTQE
jgi:hypothetical protein